MKHAKKAFLASLLSVVLCVTMLVGTTYAWFTDSVTSAGNKIIAGNLDIDLFQWTGANASTEITDLSAPIFGSGETANAVSASTLWEPGKTQVAYLSLKNNGSLWLKYTVKLVVKNVSKDLYKVMRYEIVPDETYGGVTAWDATNGVAIADDIAAGANATIETGSENVPMAPGAEHFFALAIHMQEEAGNEYQAGEVDFDIQVLATQYTSESDSFNNQYDAAATYPAIEVASGTTGTALTLTAADAVVTVPATVVETGDQYALTVSNKNVATDAVTGDTTVSYDITLEKNGTKVTSNGQSYTIVLNVGSGLNVTAVKHNGANVEPFTYDAIAGTVTFETDSFSPFSVVYQALEKWNGAVGTLPEEENGVYTLSSAAELAAFAAAVNEGNTFAGKTVVLDSDIDLDNRLWTPIGRIGSSSTDFTYAFKGFFDGQNHTVFNLNVNNEGWAGLFGIAYRTYSDEPNAMIKNLNICGATINSNRMAGALIGQIYGSIQNIHVTNVTVTGVPNLVGSGYDNGDKIGGIVGWLGDNGNHRIIDNCSATNVTLKAYRDVGGIAGHIQTTTTISNCRVNGITITVDQETNNYGTKATNAGYIFGRVADASNYTMTNSTKEGNNSVTYIPASLAP